MMRPITLWYLCTAAVFCLTSVECSHYIEPLTATKDGDIIIGGLFPVHESVDFRDGDDGKPSERNCTR